MTATAVQQDHGRHDGRKLKLTRASEIRAKKVHFLAKDLLPMGTLTVLSGNSGIGKTTIALHYLAGVTRGTLDGFCYGKPQNVIILSPEDDEASVTRPRLEAAGADLDRVVFMSATRRTENGEIDTYVSFPNDTEMLIEAVKETSAAAVMIDPIASLVAGNLDKREDVRASFDRLAAEVAKEYQLAIILIAHNKKGMDSVRGRISGSAAITDAARSVLAVAKNEEDESVVMTVDKSSYSNAAGLSLEFRLASVDVPIRNDQTTTVARAELVGFSDVSVAELNARQSGEEQEQDDRNAAQGFLIDYLSGQPGGEAKAGEVIKAARASGFSESEIKNARRRVMRPRVTSNKSKVMNAGWVWALEYDTEDATKVSKVSVLNTMTPSAPSLTPSTDALAPVTPIGGDRA